MTRTANVSIDAGATRARLGLGLSPDAVREVPNYLLTGRRPVLRRPPSDPWDAIHLRVLDAPCDIAREFCFGQLAQDHGGTPLDPEVSKLSAPQIRHAVVALLASHAAECWAEHSPISVFNMAIGCPMLDFDREAERNGFALQFRGNYRVEFVGASNPHWAGRVMEFRVQGLTVVCEGEPAISMTEDTGEEFRASCDVGGSTIDLAVFRRNRQGVLDLQGHLCGAGPIPLARSMSELATTLGRVNGGIEIHPDDVADALVNRQGRLRIGNATSDVTVEAAAVLESIAEQVADYMHQVWQGCPGLTAFTLMGGGSVILAPFLIGALAKTFAPGPVRFDLRTVDHPRLVNALGFWWQAQEAFGHE